MNRRKKQMKVFFTGFFVTLVLAGAFLGFVAIDSSLRAAGFGGTHLTEAVTNGFYSAQEWVSALWEAAKTAIFSSQNP